MPPGRRSRLLARTPDGTGALQLGGERKRPFSSVVVERLDSETVARKNEPLSRPIPDRDREHAAKPLGELQPAFLVEVDEDLCITLRAKAVTGGLELLPQLAIVVDLAVLNDVNRPILVCDRLIA